MKKYKARQTGKGQKKSSTCGKKRVGDFGRFAGHIGREKRELECNYGQK